MSVMIIFLDFHLQEEQTTAIAVCHSPQNGSALPLE